jgi:hypothetical protein
LTCLVGIGFKGSSESAVAVLLRFARIRFKSFSNQLWQFWLVSLKSASVLLLKTLWTKVMGMEEEIGR